MRISLKRFNPFGFLVVSTKREHYLAQYVVREHARGRSLDEIVDDPYVRNRSTAEERARLFERPEVVAAVGKRALDDLKSTLARAHGGERAETRAVRL